MEIKDSPYSPHVKASVIAGASLVLGLLFDYFFYGKIPGIAFPLYIIVAVAGLFTLAHLLKKEIHKEVFWLLAPLLFFSGMVFVRSSYLLTFFNIAASVLLLFVIIELSFGSRIKNFLIADYVKIFLLPFKFLASLFQTLSVLFLLRNVRSGERNILPVLKGIAMTLPVLVVFLFLFSSADLVFQKYVSDIFTLGVAPETYVRSLIVLFVTFFCIGAYAYALRPTNDREIFQKGAMACRVGHIESSIMLGSVNALFFIFILVQFAYLFGGEGSISAQGFTYAEYARRGFFELIAVAIISLLLLLVSDKVAVKNDARHMLGFKMLSGALVIQVILIMASSFTRLLLYEDAYGFTTMRLYSHAFIILLAVVLCLLLYKIFRNGRENTFMLGVFASIVLFLAAMNFFNPDAFIARRNIDRYAMTGQLDIHYITFLSDDGIPDAIDVLNIPDEDLRKNFARELYWRIENGNDPFFSRWQSLNLSRMRAAKVLSSKIPELEGFKFYQGPNISWAE